MEFCLNKLNQLRHYRIKPIMVFDGAPLPMKGGREEERRRSRESSRQRALELLAKGEREQARLFIQKSIDVTPEMAARLILALRREGIEYMVAPYEADAQMAYLDRQGRIAAVITEDSDLILFGCRRILYKLDRDGWADEVCLERLGGCEEIDLQGFTLDRFRQMCILSGCDYLPSPPGMGLRTAHKYLLRHKSPDRLLQAIKSDWHGRLPLPDYEQAFIRAELTFRHQVVWCPEQRKRVHLDPVDPDYHCPDWSFLGTLEHPHAESIALGDLHPHHSTPLTPPTTPPEPENVVVNEAAVKDEPIRVNRSHFFAERVTVKQSTRQYSTSKKGAFTFSKPVSQSMKGLPTCYYSSKKVVTVVDPMQAKLPFVKKPRSS